MPTTPPAEAVIVVVPTETGDATPLLLTIAMLGLLEFQPAETVPMVPSEKVACAVNVCISPAESEIVGLLGLTVMVLIVLLLTVRTAVDVTLLLLDFAVMVVFPSATAVARPALSMVAMLVADESHVTWDVTSPAVLFPKVAVAVNCCVAVGRM